MVALRAVSSKSVQNHRQGRMKYTGPSWVGLCMALLLLNACRSDVAAPTIMTGDSRTHDPAMIRADDTYYVFSTGDERGLNQGNIQIRRSTDLANWELVGTVFDAIPQWITDALGGTPPNLWAPDITYRNGQYYLYYAGSRFGTNNSVIGLATNTTLDPTSADYKWVDQGLVLQSRPANNWNAIDPNISFDADGKPWMAFGSFWDGIKMARIDPSTGKTDTEDRTLYRLASRGGGAIEAPAIVARDGYYYLFVSFDVCCRGVNSTYNIRAGRATSITGPYLDRNGTDMANGGGDVILEGDARFRGPGGQSVYRDGDTYRLVYHAYDASQNGTPQLQIRDLRWTGDGWPTLQSP